MAKSTTKNTDASANLGFEAKLWHLVSDTALGSAAGRARDTLGRVYESLAKPLTADLYQHRAGGANLEAAIAAKLKELGYGGG